MKKIRFLLLALVALVGGLNASATKTVYIQPNSWTDNNTQISVWAWTQGEGTQTSNSDWATLTAVPYETGIFKAELDDAINSMLVKQGGQSWEGEAQTANLTIEDGKLYKLYDCSGSLNGISTNCGVVVESYTEPLLRDYYLEGDVALVSEGWNAADGNKMTKGEDNKFTLTKENVLLTVGEYKYKTFCSYGDGTWYPAGDNKVLTITENGYYTVAFTFDLDEGEPTAVATKTGAIGYIVDFETPIATSNHAFAVAPMWKHIVGSYNDNYVSYSYCETDGINGSGCLLVYDQNKYISYSTRYLYDLLVTPKVSGTIKLKVRVCISADATSYKNAFVQLYSLNESATEKGDLLKEFKTEIPGYNSGSGDWVELSYDLGDTPQRIGIRAQYVYMDNFIADGIDNSPEPALGVMAVMNSNGATGTTGTNPTFAQQEDGTMKVQLKVTLSNTGNVDFVAGTTENYTVTPATGDGTKTYYEDATIAIPEDLAAGETKTFDFEFTTPFVSGYNNWYIRENVTGTTSTSYRYAQSVAYESKFIFDVSGTSYYSSSSATTKAIEFGKITSETTLNYEIYNSGSAPLVINSFSVPAPFISDAPEGEFTVAAGEKKQIAITLPISTAGVFAGNLTVEYTNYGKTQATYTLGISGTVIDSSKNWITFSNADNSNGQFPEGSIHADAVYITSKTESGATNYYLQSTSTVTKFITPLLTAEAGEAFTYDAWYGTYTSSGSTVTVYSSTDRVNWTQIDCQTSPGNISSKPTTFTVSIEDAGDYYLAFELTGNAFLDNIYGLTLATAPAHDWYFTEEATIPATGKQNSDYTASIKVQNIASVADVVETATLYVGGEAVVTLNNVALAANDKTAAVGTGRTPSKCNIDNPTEITFTYKPHTFGDDFKAYIELKSGDKVVTTDEVDVTIAEEKVENEIGLANNGTNGATPLNLNYNNSESVSLYTADVLTNELGLNVGDKISSITFKGYKTDVEHSTLLSVYYEWTDDTQMASPTSAGLLDVTGMTAYTENELHTWKTVGSYNELDDIYVMNFDEPLEYNGKGLRIVMRSLNQLNGSNYKQVYWEKSTVYQNPSVSGTYLNYRHYTDTSGERDAETNYTTSFTASWGYEYLPAIHLGLFVEPTTLAGTVTDANGAVEGATVTIRNEANDVEYFATTAADGSYSINVIQDNLTYVAVADKDGFVAPVQNVASFTDALDFTLAAPAYGEIDATASAGYFKYLAQEDDKLVVTYTENPTVDNVVKFTKPNDWGTVYAYAWNSSDQPLGPAWHGTQLTDYYLNEFTQQVYSFTVPNDAVGIIFNDGGSNQTVNITDFTVTGYYTDGSKDGEDHYNVIAWTDNNTAIELFDAKGAKVADATLDNGTATVELTDAIIAKLAAGLYVTVKGTEATITKVELVKDDSYILTENATGVTAGTYAKVKIEREFKAGWNAVVLPFDLSAAEVTETFGENSELAVYDGDEGEDKVTVKFKKIKGEYKYMTASYPYLIWLESPVSGVKFTNKTIESETPGAAVEKANTFEYVGVYTTTTTAAGDYFVQGGEFRKTTATNTVKPFRAYLKQKTPGVRSVNFVIGDEEATEIEGLTVERNYSDDAIYNLSGQKVQNMNRKGLYIINGKKVMVK